MTTQTQSTVLTVHIPLRWGDMDAYGHINNVTLLQILEEARIAVFGAPPSSGKGSALALIPLFSELEEGTQALVAENHIKYRAQLEYRGEPVRIEVRLTAVTPATVTVTYEVFDPVTGTHCVSGSTVLAFYHSTHQRLTRLTRYQRELLTGYIV